MAGKQNIYAELSFRGIKDGVVFANPIVPMPNQTLETYNVIQNKLMELLKELGILSEELHKAKPTT